jgi:hypothetical protein
VFRPGEHCVVFFSERQRKAKEQEEAEVLRRHRQAALLGEMVTPPTAKPLSPEEFFRRHLAGIPAPLRSE